MNPRVVLERLQLDSNYVRSVLSNVPGLNDFEMLRPSNVNHIVNVVQITGGGRSTTTGPAAVVQNTQTSTQVSPHIQRIGQPRSEKTTTAANNSDNNTTTSITMMTTTSSTINTQPSIATTTTTTTIIKPGTSQNSSINILQQQIIRGPINIVSHQIIRPATLQQQQQQNKIVSNTNNAEIVSKLATAEQSPTLTNDLIVTKNQGSTIIQQQQQQQQSTILQFICKSSLPKFQQAFGKSVYQQNNTNTTTTQSTTSATTTITTTASTTVNNNTNDNNTVVVGIDTNNKKSLLIKNALTTSTTTTQAVNLQSIQGGVIYTRQMPVGQTINLIPPGRGQVFRIATTANSDQISLVKDSVIHSKMSALLAAALQGKQKSSNDLNQQLDSTVVVSSADNKNVDDTTARVTTTITRPTLVQNARIVNKSSSVLQIPSNVIRTATANNQANLSSTTLEQLREFDMVYKQIKERSSTNNTPNIELLNNQSNDNNDTTVVTTTATITTTTTTPPQLQQQQGGITVTYLNQGQKFTQISPVVVVSSTNYCNLQSVASPALSITSQGSSSPCITPAPPTVVATKLTSSLSTTTTSSSSSSSSSSVKSATKGGKTLKNNTTTIATTTTTATITTAASTTTTTQASKSSPIPKPQQKPQEDEHTAQRIFDILAEYAEQLRNSPDLNNKPAPRRRSNPPTNPSQNSKRKKNSSSAKKTGQCSNMLNESDLDDHRTVGSEDSSCGVQISLQDDEQSSSTQLQQQNSCDTIISNNNDNNLSLSSTNSRQQQQQLILTDASGNNATQTRNLIIADSTSVGEALKIPNTAVLVPGNYIMPVSMVKGGQQIAVVSGGSKILATVPARSGPNMLLFQSFLNQNRKSIGSVSTVKYSTIQPISGISSQTLAGVSGQPPVILPSNSHHNLTTVTLGQPITLKKMNIDTTDRVNTELLLTISKPRDGNNGNLSNDLTSNSGANTTDTIVANNNDDNVDNNLTDDHNHKIFHTYQKSIVRGTSSVIAQTTSATVKNDGNNTQQQQHCQNDNNKHNSIITTTLNISQQQQQQLNKKNESSKNERIQSVLVAVCTTNGPMLSQTPPRYCNKQNDNNVNASMPSATIVNNNVGTTANNESSSNNGKEELLHNGEKPNNNQNPTIYFHNNKTKKNCNQRLDRELHQLCLQRKQAAIERELRLQKSLSEECEDLGVDEPSTSDLFPEADILFDSNHSPSFDQSSQDLLKRSSIQSDIIINQKNDIVIDNNSSNSKSSSMVLFSDDDNSSSLRTNFLFDSSVNYHHHHHQTVQGNNDLDYNIVDHRQRQQLTNGQSSASNGSGSSCDDNTLLPNCTTSISDVALNSPISPDDPYQDNTTSILNKYKFKYSNRRKCERNNKQQQLSTTTTTTTAIITTTATTTTTTASLSLSTNIAQSTIVENWTTASSSEDTTDSSNDLIRKSPTIDDDDDDDDDDDMMTTTCTNKRSRSISCDDDLSDGSFKLVRVAISKNDDLSLKGDELSCDELHCDDDLDQSISGRGARRSVKKMCSCCNGSSKDGGGVSRKKPASRPQTPAPHKKAFLNKKR